MKKLLCIGAAFVVVYACSEPVGQMLVDAGDMLADAGDVMRDAGDMMQPDAGAQDVSASCNKSESYMVGDIQVTQHWAEFPVTPGRTEVTVCSRGDSQSHGAWKRDACYRWAANWFDGTSTGFVTCGDTWDGERRNEPKSITVHS